MALFRTLGPDLMVTCFAVNLRLKDGPNPDQAIMNEVNEATFRALSIESGRPGEIPAAPMFVTSFDAARAGLWADDRQSCGSGGTYLIAGIDDFDLGHPPPRSPGGLTVSTPRFVLTGTADHPVAAGPLPASLTLLAGTLWLLEIRRR